MNKKPVKAIPDKDGLSEKAKVATKLILDFDKSKRMCWKVELAESEDILKSYQTLYQANRRIKNKKNPIKVCRVNNEIYLSKE